jgi:hypothetical protein
MKAAASSTLRKSGGVVLGKGMNFGCIRPLLIVLALAAAGCRADCESNCEEHKACSDASQEERSRDCADYCEQLDKVNKDHCEDQYDAMLSCENAQEDLCSISAEQACARQRTAWVVCKQPK